MKTIQELYNEVMGNEELKAKFVEAANAGKLEALLKEQGCEATLDEVAAFLKVKTEEDAPLSMDELDSAAGGNCQEAGEIAASVLTAGVVCALTAGVSAIVPGRHVGQKSEDEGRLCNPD